VSGSISSINTKAALALSGITVAGATKLGYDALHPAPFEEFPAWTAPEQTTFTIPASTAGEEIASDLVPLAEISESSPGLEYLGTDLSSEAIAAALAPTTAADGVVTTVAAETLAASLVPAAEVTVSGGEVALMVLGLLGLPFGL
jgi:hypothetical protein